MAAKITFNKGAIAALKVPAKGRTYVYDARTPGLAVCITCTGTRTFYLYRWANGRPLRQRLGTTDELTVEQARTQAQKLTGEIVQGVDVQARKRAAREEMTFGELFGRWMEHAREHKRTWPEDQRQYDKFLSTWAPRRLRDIDPTDVERLHHRVKAQSGPYQANRVVALLNAMFRKAIETRAWRGDNPATGIRKFQEHTRDRFLLPEEMARFFKALKAVEPEFQDFFALLLLTGQRRGAVQSMRWEDVDLDGATWTVPAEDSKNKLPITLPLVPEAVGLLERRLSDSDGSGYVFSSRGKTGHIVEPKGPWRKVVEASGLKGLRMHDLRRTLGSWQAAAGVGLPIIGKSLGHANGSQATAVYARLQLDPVRQAMTTATAAMIKASKGGARGKKA